MTRPRLLLGVIVLLPGCAGRHFFDHGHGSAASEVQRRAEEQALSDAEALRQLREEAQRLPEAEEGV